MNPEYMNDRATVLKSTTVSILFTKRKNFRNALENLEFNETTRYLEFEEEKHSWYSNFEITVCGETSLVNCILMLVTLLGNE